jgi:diacylglycerol kinase family enzyme
VFCRVLGIPNDVVDATEHLLALADAFEPRRVDVGRVGSRHFVFSSGVGLDASVVERVDRQPRLKARLGEWFYAGAALSTFSRRYLVDPPRVRLELGNDAIEAVTVIVQNADPFTFFGDRPIRVGEGAGLGTGSLTLTALRRSTALELPTLLPRLLSTRAATVQGHRRIRGFPEVGKARIVSVDDRPFPVQVDGDFIGDFDAVDYGVVPGGLLVVA